MSDHTVILLLLSINLFSLAMLIIFAGRYKNYKQNLEIGMIGTRSTIESQDAELKQLRHDLSYFKGRTEHLEDKVEQDYGVSVRNVVTEVKADFSKLEMVVIQSGVMKVLKNSDNVDDIEFYLGLAKKIQEFLDTMKDDSEDKPQKEKTQ